MVDVTVTTGVKTVTLEMGVIEAAVVLGIVGTATYNAPPEVAGAIRNVRTALETAINERMTDYGAFVGAPAHVTYDSEAE